MRKLLQILLLVCVILLTGCEKPIFLRGIGLEHPGVKMFGYVPQRNFYINEMIGTDLEFKWLADTYGSFNNNSVLVFGDYIFAADMSGRLYNFNRETGKQEGFFSEKGVIAITPTVQANKIIYAINKIRDVKFEVIYFDFTQGKISNVVEIKGSCSNEFIVLDDGIILLTDQGKLMKLNIAGVELWSYDSDNITFSTPGYGSDKVYFGNVEGEITCVNAKTGKLVYQKKVTENRIQSGVTISGGKGYVGDMDGNLTCFDAEDGTVLWRQETGSSIKSLPVTNSDYCFVSNLSGGVYAFGKENGNMEWELFTDGLMNVTPLVFNDYLVQPDMAKRILFIDINTGDVDKEITFERRTNLTPVYYDGVLYFGTNWGEIHAYEKIK